MMTKEVTDPCSPQLLVWSHDHDDDHDHDDVDNDDDHDNDYNDDQGSDQLQLLVWSHPPTHLSQGSTL